MRKKIYLPLYVTMLILLITVFTKREFQAFSAGDYNQKELTAAGYLATDGEEVAMDYIRRCNNVQPGAIRAEAIEHYLDRGYLTGYVEELRQSGYISPEYAVKTDSSTSTVAETSEKTKEPQPFTVELYDPEKTMWASQEVNYRDGASTDYGKLGSFQKHDAVTVTGLASTGWYQVVPEDGVTAYVSGQYLTEENPAERTVFRYNEADKVVQTIRVESEDPEIVDKVVEQITSVPQMVEKAVKSEQKPEMSAKSDEDVQPEPVLQTDRESNEHFNIWYLMGAAGSVIIFYIALVMIMRRKRIRV